MPLTSETALIIPLSLTLSLFERFQPLRDERLSHARVVRTAISQCVRRAGISSDGDDVRVFVHMARGDVPDRRGRSLQHESGLSPSFVASDHAAVLDLLLRLLQR